MEITFNFTHVFFPGSDPVENADVLRATLEYLTKINLMYLRNHTCPALYHSGVRYGRTVLWEPIPALYRRGFGDCKSLSAAYIAQQFLLGNKCKPVFRFVKNVSGGTDYHILVHDPKNSRGFEDPSKVLGMGANENARFYPTGR